MQIWRVGTLRLATIVAGCSFLFTFVPSVFADGTLMGTAHSTLLNPCNGEIVKGPVDFLLVVQTNQTAQGPHIVVHRTFHGTLQGNLGNEYEVRSVGQAEFDALSSQYALSFENNVVGKGSAPNFTATGTVTVFVDADQNPTGYSAVATGAVCK